MSTETKKDEVKKDEAKKVVEETPKELTAVDAKIKEIQEKYNEKVKEKNELTNKIRGINEELVKFAGAFQSLNELRNDLKPKEDKPEDEGVNKAEPSKEKNEK